MWYFAKLITVSTYIDVLSWDLDTMILGGSHTCDLNRHGVKGHLGVNDLWFKFLEKRVSVSTYFDVFSNLILQWLQKYVIAKAGETCGSRTALSWYNDPWGESHMWPQQTWGQRSSRGQWPLVQVFGKKGQCIHILWCIFKSNITMIAKVCDRESRRDLWFENRLVLII